MGNVVVVGPDKNSEVKKSSILKMNVRSIADKIAGLRSGKVILNITWLGLAPKSLAASKIKLSKSRRRERMGRKANGKQNVM